MDKQRVKAEGGEMMLAGGLAAIGSYLAMNWLPFIGGFFAITCILGACAVVAGALQVAGLSD